MFVRDHSVEHSKRQRTKQKNNPFRNEEDHSERDGDGIIKYFLEFNKTDIRERLKVISIRGPVNADR